MACSVRPEGLVPPALCVMGWNMRRGGDAFCRAGAGAPKAAAIDAEKAARSRRPGWPARPAVTSQIMQ